MSLTQILQYNIPHRPALFNAEMVPAILDGRKTQTRRIMKPQPVYSDGMGKWVIYPKEHPTVYADLISAPKYCPYGQPGDLLWVREAWCRMDGEVFFKSSVKHPDTLRWKPSIHMPKEAARIWLRITEVRVERLKDIPEEDAIAEGVESAYWETVKETRYRCYISRNRTPYAGLPSHWASNWKSPKESFISLWGSINGMDSWKTNPWVWVIKFEVLSTIGAPSVELLSKHFPQFISKGV